jgi:energy-converting hydrogenase Eha subunit A
LRSVNYEKCCSCSPVPFYKPCCHSWQTDALITTQVIAMSILLVAVFASHLVRVVRPHDTRVQGATI